MSLTEVNPASENCQRWSNGRHTWRHTSEGGFDPQRYAVEAIDEATAKHYVLQHHYSGSYPSALSRYGMFDGDRLVGVLVFGSPTSNAVLTNVFPDLAPHYEAVELSRLVLADEVPANAETWFIARCFEAAALRGVRGVVSFADPVPRSIGSTVLFPGHIGTIYQASNAVFSGRSTARTLTLLPSGEVLNDRSKQKVRSQERGHDHVEQKLIGLGARAMRAGEKPAEWLKLALDDIGTTKVRHRGCFRYCFTVGTKSQRRNTRIALVAESYPKEVDTA